MDVVGDGFAHEILGHTEMLRKIPHFRVAVGNGLVQLVGGYQLADRPFIRPVFMAAAQVVWLYWL